MLRMMASVLDPCFFFRATFDDRDFDGAQAILVDDTLGTGSEDFARDEMKTGQVFQTKTRIMQLPFKFNGAYIEQSDLARHAIRMHQIPYTSQLGQLKKDYGSDDFATLRGQVAYAAACTRPDVSFISAKLAQLNPESTNEDHVKLLNHAVKHLPNQELGLVFRKLDLESLRVVGYSDASFAGNDDLSSQLGMIVLLMDSKNNATIMHYASWKCRRVTRSILAAEVHSFAACLDYTMTFRYDLNNIMKRSVPILHGLEITFRHNYQAEYCLRETVAHRYCSYPRDVQEW